jgi:ABC-2 type transport system permease protein
MQVINFGDVLFALIVLITFAKMTWIQLLFFFPVTILVAFLFLSVFTLFSSLVFFLRNSETLSSQMSNIFLMISSYPASIFDRGVKIILFSLFPAALVSTFPVMIIKEQSLSKLLILFFIVLFYFLLSLLVFYQGLKRYESGNLISLKR